MATLKSATGSGSPFFSPWDGKGSGPVASRGGPSLTDHQNTMLNPVFTQPPHTSGSQGVIAVNSDAMMTFAANIGKLLPMVQDALRVLQDLRPVRAGCFFEAYNLNKKVSTGESGTKPLVDNYSNVLYQCYQGLLDLQGAVHKIASKYSTVDEWNKMSVTELANDLAPASGDFNHMMAANGGTGGGTSAVGG